MLVIITNVDINSFNSEHIWLGIWTLNVFNATELWAMNVKMMSILTHALSKLWYIL